MNQRSPQPGDDSPLLDEQLKAGLRGDFKKGHQIAVELERKFLNNHRAAFNRAWYHMMNGDLLKGLECLDRGRWIGVFGDGPLPTSKPIYHNEPLAGRHLLMCSEGGLGDEIINIRFANRFAEQGAKVSVTCDPSLASVFARVEGVGAVVLHKGAPVVYHDVWVPAMSAAHVLRCEYPQISGKPYLTVDPIHREKWSQILKTRYPNGHPRIGARFYGNPKFEHEQFRRFPKGELVEALGGHAWLNLQKEETDLPIETWEDTLALIEHLDLVVTSCTSVAHASAALGKPTWVLVPLLPYYIWAYPGQTSPWYEAVRLFRQTQHGNWKSVFVEIREALGRYAKSGTDSLLF
jgi:hypothetical protein